ncbi:MAG: M28 family peptidase [Verrucomicrobiae bacterium]|nr:M28 family peptidase [Verrucomicrobiae bacterium]
MRSSTSPRKTWAVWCRSWGFLFSLALLSSCGSSEPWADRFQGDRCWNDLKAQTAIGPRPSGTPELEKTRQYLERELRAAGWKVTRQTFSADTPGRGRIEYCNLIAAGDWPPSKPVLVLASHYDTKWLPKIRFVGANDGASSTACLLEIARCLRSRRDEFALVFFDGEEAVVDYTENDGLFGSRHFQKVAEKEEWLKNLRGLVLMDMVGDADLNVAIPDGDPALIRDLFEAAEKVGTRGHFSLLGTGMVDDHSPFLLSAVPAVDLIDFRYGPANSYWHTEQDNDSHVSAESLRIVGRTVLQFLQDGTADRK